MSFFVKGSYDELRFQFPNAGMNQNISPRALPSNFAYVLENIIPLPIGQGTIRNGTRKLINLSEPDSSFLEVFSYLMNSGSEQLIIYASDFVLDTSVFDNVTIPDVRTIVFGTTNEIFYQKDTKIKIVYSGPDFGNTNMYCNIQDVSAEEPILTVTLADNFFPDNIDDLNIVSISYSVGNIYSYDPLNGVMSGALNENPLSVACVPRSTTFQGVLLICNGVDRIMAWDGSDLTIVTDYVKEDASAFNRLTDNSFSFIGGVTFNINKYPVGEKIKLNVDGLDTDLVVLTTNQVDDLITIVVDTDDVPEFTGENEVYLTYADYPPTFSYLFVAHQRIWALGPGAVSIQFRDQNEALRVYFTNRLNTYTGWFDEKEKIVQSIIMSNRHGLPDNFEAICSVNNYIAFIGRNKTQVWQGIDPTENASEENRFSWAYNLPIGIVHGNLLVELPNDVYIADQNGIISLSKFNVAQQVGATSTNAVDPLVRDYIQSINQSNVVYRTCRAFKYDNGPFCGFKIGYNSVLTSLYATSLYSWFFLSGDFKNSSTIVNGSINSLYLAVNSSLYKYGDGKDGDIPIYGDADGSAFIPFYWTLPIVDQRGSRFANKRYSIEMGYSSSFIRNKTNGLFVGVLGDIRKTFNLENQYNPSSVGDSLGSAPLLFGADPDPNEPSPDSPGMRLDIASEIIFGKLKFVSSSFWLYITGYTRDGPVFFDNIELYGIRERKS